jgi:O-methyltransferase
VYDSFAGLPEKAEQDRSVAGDQFESGKLNATKSQFIKNFKKANLKLPHIHKSWFDELSENDVPSPIAFAFLDGDFYHSIRSSLSLVWDKLSPGAIVVIDDYASESLPGAKRAADEWLRGRTYKRFHVEESLAIVEL